LVLAPLLLAVLANFGIMGLTGIRLNTTTAIIAAISVGIGADYSIYMVYRIREELARCSDEGKAVKEALSTAGRAILFVASAVAGGYAVLVCSYGFWSYIKAALLIASSMLVSAFAALIIVPSLVLTLRPRFLFSPERGNAASPDGATRSGHYDD
jgi:predicted RND superfamily exporter protein